jgi:hypothetical protein
MYLHYTTPLHPFLVSKSRQGAREETVQRRCRITDFTDYTERVPLSGSAGGRFAGVIVPLLGIDRCVEVKVRGTGCGQLYNWLEGRDLLIARADRREPLVILPLRLAVEIAQAAEWGKAVRAPGDQSGPRPPWRH